MEVAYLEESVIDMLACDWERKFKGREDITRFWIQIISINNQTLYYDVSRLELASGVDPRFLERYTIGDRTRVEEILQEIIRKT